MAQVSRRQFLRAGTGLAFGAGLGMPFLQWLADGSSEAIATPRIWKDLATNLEGTLFRPDSPKFAERARPWALRYADKLPQGIAQCTSETDIRTCLQWAQANKIPLVTRSGGHSYAGYSTTTGLMISVSAMNSVNVDQATGLATLGGGARNRNVYAECKPLGRAVTHGRCKDVGVAGLVLGGGIGFNMRSQGLTCDQLVETKIMLANGRVLTCNEKSYADLFWACRGAGGGNFGIHTSFTFQTFPVDRLTVFQLTWTDRIVDIFKAIQTMTATAPDNLGIKVSITAKKQANSTVLSLSILGQLTGSIDELNALLAPILFVQKPSNTTIQNLPYWEAQEFVSEEGLPEYSHERSRFVKGQLSDEALQTIISNLKAWPGTSLAATWKYFLLGGKINQKQPQDMAFVHRGYSMLSSIELEWKPEDFAVMADNEQWLSTFHDQMEDYTTAYCYQNFIDPSQKNYLQAYYGDNLPKLQAIKRKYDPTNVFRYPQSIPV